MPWIDDDKNTILSKQLPIDAASPPSCYLYIWQGRFLIWIPRPFKNSDCVDLDIDKLEKIFHLPCADVYNLKSSIVFSINNIKPNENKTPRT